jgi:capsular exopolysaccharide synthesis family protein
MKSAALTPSAEKSAGSKAVELRARTYAASLVTLSPQHSAASEAIRALRTHIIAQHFDRGRRALALCAPTIGVGCTFVASNLAVALSQIGINTLLIDANLRGPGLGRVFDAPPSVTGLRQRLMEGRRGTFDHIVPDVLPNLSIMYSGGVDRNAQELLAGQDFTNLMSFCLRDYDLTIIDTPPANICSDALRISSVVGYSVIVARRDMTRASDVRVLASQLQLDGARIVGTVMTEA